MSWSLHCTLMFTPASVIRRAIWPSWPGTSRRRRWVRQLWVADVRAAVLLVPDGHESSPRGAQPGLENDKSPDLRGLRSMRRRGLEPPPGYPGPGPQPGNSTVISVRCVPDRPYRPAAGTMRTHRTIWMLPGTGARARRTRWSDRFGHQRGAAQPAAGLVRSRAVRPWRGRARSPARAASRARGGRADSAHVAGAEQLQAGELVGEQSRPRGPYDPTPPLRPSRRRGLGG